MRAEEMNPKLAVCVGCLLAALVGCFSPAFYAPAMASPVPSKDGAAKIHAQQLVDDAARKHPELTSLEMSATPPGQEACETIAATEAKDVAEKCDEDEFKAMESGKPFVEKEPEGFDITLPLHDASGKMIGALGMDFKPEAGQQEASVVARAMQIAREIEKHIPAEEDLFKPVD